ncbi:hypothetical protein COLO4_29417 [Corchorus olitorius]|uniref:Uncharacterized protein n=1 Tax=Corchorus olitorius TaxID=93759 RepID=A0A1R3HEK8_9ROSI|nr:hypothetical protein COLO4_29417 [Corchorus olitorius]
MTISNQVSVNYVEKEFITPKGIEEVVIAPKLLTGLEHTPIADEAAVAKVEEVRVEEGLDNEDQVHGLLNDEEVVVNGLGFEEVVIERDPFMKTVDIEDELKFQMQIGVKQSMIRRAKHAVVDVILRNFN